MFLGGLSVRGWPSSLKGERLELIGQAHQQAGDFRASHAAYQAAWDQLSRTSDSWRLSEIALHLADMCRQREAFREALRWYGVAKQCAERSKNSRLLLDAASGTAMAWRGLGRYATSLSAFSTLLSAYRRLKDQEGEAYVLWAMGTTERFAGRLAAADRHLAEAVRLYIRLRDASGLAYARCGWGGTLRMKGEAARSRALYAQGYRYFSKVGDRFGMAYASCGQGNALRMLGRLSDALPFMKRAERHYRRLRLAGPLGFVLWSRAMLETERSAWNEATRFLSEAEAAFQRAGDPRGLVYVILGRGELARARQKPAFLYYQRAANRARRLGLLFEEAHARVRLGEAAPSIYRRFGVSISFFSRYRSLP